MQRKCYVSVFLFLLISSLTLSAGADTATTEPMQKLTCGHPYIIDGDTLTCANKRVRLAYIDAPEMPDHCRKGRRCTTGNPFKSRDHLISLTRTMVTCQPIEIDHYGRSIARCTARGKDLSCAMVAAGHAVERYGTLTCP